MRIVEPKVYLVAQTAVDYQEVKKYLTEQLGCSDWDSAAVSDSEFLVEFMGRLCYRSFAPQLNKNVTKVREGNDTYLAHIAKVGHGCYDIETDVLTSDGWKAWTDVIVSDRLATRTNDGIVEYHYPTQLIAYRHQGRMYRVSGKSVDLLVTPDHKMLACRTTTCEGRKKETFSLIPAQELGSSSHAYVKLGRWNGGSRLSEMLDEARLLGFAVGDGHLGDRGLGLKFHLRRQRKIRWLKLVVARLGWRLHEQVDRFTVTVPGEIISLFRLIYDEAGEKQIPPEFLTRYDSATQAGLLEGLLESDGCRTSTGDLYDTTSEKLAGQIQQLLMHLGLAGNISQAPCYRERAASFGDKQLFRVNIVDRGAKPEVNKFSGAHGRTAWIENWEGNVFCAEVPNHTLYVRRNGKPVWSGNSVLEHASASFVFANVSRVFTHELVRHRAGVAISQESLRFVRLDDLGLWAPTVIREDEHAMSIFARTFRELEQLQKELALHFKLDEPGVQFDLKKEVTSAMRRIAPDGLATTIGWTANFRTIRHVVAMRTNRSAEEEIRLVFGDVARLCQEKFPNFFLDMKSEKINGYDEFTFEHKKV